MPSEGFGRGARGTENSSSTARGGVQAAYGGLMSARAFVSCAYTSQMESEKIDNRTVFSLSPPQLTSSQSKRLSQVALLVLLDAEQDRRGRPPEPQQELLLLARVRLPLVLARESALIPRLRRLAQRVHCQEVLPRGLLGRARQKACAPLVVSRLV